MSRSPGPAGNEFSFTLFLFEIRTRIELVIGIRMIRSAYIRISDGHTHAGQIYAFAPVMYVNTPYFHGLYRPSDRTQVYVGCGTMFFASPMKMAGLMQIPVIILRRDGA